MPITEEQRLKRANAIWASDVPAILGVDPYKSAYDIWLEKTGKVLPTAKGANYADAGQRFEPVVINWAEEQLGPLERDVEIPPDGCGIGAHLDARHREQKTPVEAKTSGLYGPLKEDWGDEGTDEVPERVIVQAQAQMLVTKTDLCHVPTFLGGRGFGMFQVERNQELAHILLEKCLEFWERHVLADVPPEGQPSMPYVCARRRIPNKIATIDPELISAWQAAQARVSESKEVEKAAKLAVLAAIADAEAGDFGDPDKIFTFMEQTRKEYVVKATTFRVPRIVKRGRDERKPHV